MKTYKIMLMALMLLTASLSITSVDAEAKAYKAKNVTVTSGKSKTVTTSKKIKKVAICSTNKNFTVKKTGNKKFKVSGTDVGKTQTVKVTYTNKYTQKFKIKTTAAKKKTVPSYAQKIVNELKPLLADPDKGLQTVLADWTKRLNPRNGYTYEFILRNFNYGLGQSIKSYTVDDILKNYTTSQKKALILEVYFRQRMSYSGAAKGSYASYKIGTKSNTEFKKLYNGTFKGVCADGANIAYDICQYLGIKACYAGSMNINHGWCGIWATDKNGVSYWHGIFTTSYPYSLKASAPVEKHYNMTEAQVKKYLYSPAATYFKALQKYNKTPKPVVAKTPTPAAATQAPVQTPAPTAAPTKAPVAATEPTKAPAVTQEPLVTQEPTAVPTVAPTTEPVVTAAPAPSQAPVVTPEPTVKPAPAPSETPAEQRIVIPHDEHGYTCPGCKAPNRHTSKTNPYITNGIATDGDLIIYKHTTSEGVRWFDADGNEYIDINKNGFITDELYKLAG